MTGHIASQLVLWTVLALTILAVYCFGLRQEARRRDLSVRTRKLVMLDLDGTLVSLSAQAAPGVQQITVGNKEFYLQLRPFLREFLGFLQQHFEVGVYTAATEEYANAVLSAIGLNVSEELRLSRSCCKKFHEKYIKDLELVEPDLSQVLIIDDNPGSVRQQRNTLAVPSWTGGSDTALLKAINLLHGVTTTADVRECCLDLSFF